MITHGRGVLMDDVGHGDSDSDVHDNLFDNHV